MAETRAQMLQREYLASLTAQPAPVVKQDVSGNYKDVVDVFWIYQRPFTLLFPVLPPRPMQFKIAWHEVNQIKYGQNKFLHAH